MSTPEEVRHARPTRTFLAVYPDAAARAALDSLLADLAPLGRDIRWTRVEQLHFTLRFFGDLDAVALARAGEVAAAVAAGEAPLSVTLDGLGAFPDWRRPRVVWVGVGDGGAALEALAARLEEAFAGAGLGRADKPFRAHLTIGRVREGARLPQNVVDRLAARAFRAGPMRVEELRLMASRLGAGGAEHRVVRAVPLGPAGRPEAIGPPSP
jgi:2'-5' RNA ligase